jgi:hypothetical protein
MRVRLAQHAAAVHFTGESGAEAGYTKADSESNPSQQPDEGGYHFESVPQLGMANGDKRKNKGSENADGCDRAEGNTLQRQAADETQH